MNKRRTFYFLLLFFSILIACKKDSPDPILLNVTPDYLIFSRKAGNIVTFQVQATSGVGLSKFVLTSKKGNSFTQTLKDSSLSDLKTFNYTYEYLVLNDAASYSVVISFRIIDKNGDEKSTARQINVTINDSPLVEYTGNTFYSLKSQKADAYNLVNLTPQFSTIAVSEIRDLQNAPDNDNSDILTKSWISPAGGKFVLFNGFDYVNASRLSLQNAYLTGTKLDKISNLQEDDIILTKLGRPDSAVYAAIRIVQIADEALSENDRYVFNVKK
jgi:hypothetical protein